MKTTNITLDTNLTMFTSVCSVQLFLESYETLKSTGYYKTEIKNKGNNFVNSIEPLVKEVISNSFQQDEETMQLVIGGIEAIIKKLATLRPDNIAMVGDIIKGIDEGTIKFQETDENFDPIT